jgi:hypothetical protein
MSIVTRVLVTGARALVFVSATAAAQTAAPPSPPATVAFTRH